jgi:hypothetical protein
MTVRQIDGRIIWTVGREEQIELAAARQKLIGSLKSLRANNPGLFDEAVMCVYGRPLTPLNSLGNRKLQGILDKVSAKMDYLSKQRAERRAGPKSRPPKRT